MFVNLGVGNFCLYMQYGRRVVCVVCGVLSQCLYLSALRVSTAINRFTYHFPMLSVRLKVALAKRGNGADIAEGLDMFRDYLNKKGPIPTKAIMLKIVHGIYIYIAHKCFPYSFFQLCMGYDQILLDTYSCSF